MSRRRNAAEQPRVVVLTRPGCHLCEEALAVVAAVCAQTGDQWSEQDITGDPDLTRHYTDQVPVTFVDGRQHDFWRVSPERLKAALDG
ncbi:MAG: glutaredoxin family protein [Propionibacteriaceae bacterium]|nr:glutaredoxin family protein [Propionibacteriaceae bacterium]